MNFDLAPEVVELAHDRGYQLKMIRGETPLYWIENQLFIGRPFKRLEELVHFIHLLPIYCPGPTPG